MHDLQIDTTISTYKIIWGDTHRPMVSRKYWSKNRMKQMIPVWNRVLKRSNAKKNSVDHVSANSGYSTYASQPGPNVKDDSTMSSQSSVASDAEASFTQPITEDLVHSSTILTNQDSVIGSNVSFGIGIAPTCANINASQVLVAPEYKEELRTHPVIAKLTHFEWELVKRERMKQHIANNIKEIPINTQFDQNRVIYQAIEALLQKVNLFGIINITPLGFGSLEHL